MGRRPNPQRKQDLLDEIILYLGENGIGDLSLRPLARQLGTSTYTLTYQFGSKDGLLVDAVHHAEARQFDVVRGWADGSERIAAVDLLRRYWEWCREDENLKLVRLLIEATTLGRSQPEVFGDVGKRVVSDWVDLLAETMVRNGLTEDAARPLATQVYATTIGLQFDLIATGATERVDRAFVELVSGIEARLSELATA